MIPVQVLMVPQFQIVTGFGWLNSDLGVIIPRAAEAFGIFFARQYFRSVPDELIEAEVLAREEDPEGLGRPRDRKSTRLNSRQPSISYAVFSLKKKNR